jgi:hypothetical protein
VEEGGGERLTGAVAPPRPVAMLVLRRGAYGDMSRGVSVKVTGAKRLIFRPHDPPRELQLFLRLSILDGFGIASASSTTVFGGEVFGGFTSCQKFTYVMFQKYISFNNDKPVSLITSSRQNSAWVSYGLWFQLHVAGCCRIIIYLKTNLNTSAI